MPVLTLQKAQARVQVSPITMKVACFLSQHSPIFGQPASSHTVCRPCSRIMACVSRYPFETGAFTLIQSGFFGTGASARCAFSGCRGRMTVSITTTIGGASFCELYLRTAPSRGKECAEVTLQPCHCRDNAVQRRGPVHGEADFQRHLENQIFSARP